MKGITFAEQGKAVVEELEKPSCGSDQILIRTLWSGMTNGTERNFLMGGNYCPGFPNRAGYQLVGKIVEVGPAAEGYAVADLVYCGHFIGHLEYVAVRAAEDNLVVRLESGIAPEEAALFGVASVAMHDCRRAGITTGTRVLVMGLGVIGQFTAQHSLAMGAEVTACDPNAERREVARAWGRVACLDPSAEEGQEGLKRLGPFDVIFEDSGADVLGQLVELSRQGGTLVLVAARREVSYPYNNACRKEITVMHANHFTRDDLLLVMRGAREGTVRIRPLIRDVFPIDEAPRAYGILRDEPSRLLGTVFDWR